MPFLCGETICSFQPSYITPLSPCNQSNIDPTHYTRLEIIARNEIHISIPDDYRLALPNPRQRHLPDYTALQFSITTLSSSSRLRKLRKTGTHVNSPGRTHGIGLRGPQLLKNNDMVAKERVCIYPTHVGVGDPINKPALAEYNSTCTKTMSRMRFDVPFVKRSAFELHAPNAAYEIHMRLLGPLTCRFPPLRHLAPAIGTVSLIP